MSFVTNFFNLIIKVLSHTMVVHIYSTPNFAMEIFMSLLMCLVHILLLDEINTMIKNVNVPPIKVRIREPTPVHSSHSVNKGVVKNHPDLGVNILFKENQACVKSEWDTMGKINKILSRTLSEYFRRDLKKINSTMIGDEGMDDELVTPFLDQSSTQKISSMEKIYDYLLQEPEMQRRMNRMQDPADKEVIRLH